MEIINIADKFNSFTDHWSPRIVAELNGQEVRLAKFQGEFIWHSHDNEDEMFLVTKGQMTLSFRDGDKVLNEGEFIIVPRGVEHKPSAKEEVCVLMFEPANTKNTGNIESDLTVPELTRI